MSLPYAMSNSRNKEELKDSTVNRFMVEGQVEIRKNWKQPFPYNLVSEISRNKEELKVKPYLLLMCNCYRRNKEELKDMISPTPPTRTESRNKEELKVRVVRYTP